MYDPRNEFLSSDQPEYFDDRTVHVAIIEPIKATIDELYHTLWTLCGGGQIVPFHDAPPVYTKNERGGIGELTDLISRTLSTCRLFVEQDGIRKKTLGFKNKSKMCLSLREVFFGADYPDGTRVRHSYPDPPLYTELSKEHSEPSGQVMIAMIVYQYTKKRHRLLLAPMGGSPSVMDFWQQLVSDFKRIYPKATVATAITPPVTSQDRQQGEQQPVAIPPPDKNELSGREKEVLNLALKGLDRKEIADELIIKANTVDTHVQNICEKRKLPKITKSLPDLRQFMNQNIDSGESG
jgi:DNA-binding CsgD family transcriptional regulator